MTGPERYSPSQLAGIRVVNAAVHAYLTGDDRDAYQTLNVGMSAGLTEEIVTGLLGVAVNALIMLGEVTGVSPQDGWARFMQTSPSMQPGQIPGDDRW